MISEHRALLVNDDLFFSGRLVSVLTKQGFDVSVAANAALALESARQKSAELVIVNANSRVIDAPELIRQMRSESKACRIIAFLSHTRIPESRDRILGAGADRLCANSAITMRLPEIVKTVLSADAGPPGVEE